MYIYILCTFKDTYVREIPYRDATLAKRAKKQTIKIRDKKGFLEGLQASSLLLLILLLILSLIHVILRKIKFFNVDTSTGDSQSGDPFKSTSKAWFPGLGHPRRPRSPSQCLAATNARGGPDSQGLPEGRLRVAARWKSHHRNPWEIHGNQ